MAEGSATVVKLLPMKGKFELPEVFGIMELEETYFVLSGPSNDCSKKYLLYWYWQLQEVFWKRLFKNDNTTAIYVDYIGSTF